MFLLLTYDWKLNLQTKNAQYWVVSREGDNKSREILLLAMFVYVEKDAQDICRKKLRHGGN